MTYRMNSAWKAKLNRLQVATDSSDGRMIGSRTMNRMPVASWARMLWPAGSGVGSSALTRVRKSADAT